MAKKGIAPEWTCGRCGVTASWMSGTVRPELPSGWIEERDGLFYCLSCRREMAGEIGEARAGEDATEAGRRQAGAAARIEFEVLRHPDRADTKIARACRASVTSVRRVRERLGAYPTRPS